MQSSLWATCHHIARCSLPGAGLSHKSERHMRRRAVSHRPQTISPLLGLAPGGGYLAIYITANAGGLLHHLFTITALPRGVKRLFVSVALSGRFSRPGIKIEIEQPFIIISGKNFVDIYGNMQSAIPEIRNKQPVNISFFAI